MPRLENLKKQYPDIPWPDWIIMTAHIAHCTPTHIYAHPHLTLNLYQYYRLRYWLRRYQAGMPIAYLLKEKEFYNLTFVVNRHTLIPRPETEMIVANALNILRQYSDTALVDVGTGTGCIPIAILKNTTNPPPVIATDIARATLRVARANAYRQNVKINWRRGSLIQPITPIDCQHATLIITANLPYLTTAQINAEKSLHTEPRRALWGGEPNGLLVYEQLLTQVKQLLPHIQTQTIFLLLEIDPRQTQSALAIIKKQIPAAHIEIQKDLAGWERLLLIRLNQ